MSAYHYLTPEEKKRFHEHNVEIFGEKRRRATGRCLECGKELFADEYTFKGFTKVKNQEVCFHLVSEFKK